MVVWTISLSSTLTSKIACWGRKEYDNNYSIVIRLLKTNYPCKYEGARLVCLLRTSLAMHNHLSGLL